MFCGAICQLKKFLLGVKKMKKTVIDLREMKQRGEKISFITGYDYMTAKYEEQAGIDMILVGDSWEMFCLDMKARFLRQWKR